MAVIEKSLLMNRHAFLPCFILCLFAQLALAQVPSEKEALNFYLLRGLGRESGHWGNTFMQEVQAVYPSTSFTLLDLPGAGRFHEEPAKIAIEGMASFLQATYKDSLIDKEGKNILLATSLSGNVALEWVLHQPENFHALILVGTSLRKVCKKKERVQQAAKKEFFDIFFTSAVEEREAKFLHINSNLYAENDSILRRWIDIQEKRPVSKHTLFKQTMAGMFYLTPEVRPAIPVLVVGSRGDRIVDEVCIQKVADHLQADRLMHESAGHGIPIDAPVWLAHQVSFWTEANRLEMEEGYAQPLVYEDEQGLNDILSFGWVEDGVSSVWRASGRAVKSTVALAGL